MLPMIVVVVIFFVFVFLLMLSSTKTTVGALLGLGCHDGWGCLLPWLGTVCVCVWGGGHGAMLS